MSIEDDIRAHEEAAAAKAGAPRWTPTEVGDSIAGVVEDIRDVEGEYGPFKVATVARADGRKLSVAFTGHVLKDRFTAENVAVGRLLSVTYMGPRTSDAGRTYEAWSVLCAGPSSEG